MTDTFLKRRGGGGDGCWRGEGSDMANPLFCFLLSIRGSIQHRLSIRHDSPWITFICARNAHTQTHKLWRRHDDALVVWWCVWCVSRFAQRAVLSERPSAATLVLSVHHEHTTALGPSRLQLLGGDDCNGIASGGAAASKTERWQLNKNGKPCAFETETAKKWWIVFLQSSVVEANMPDDALKCQIKEKKKTFERS